MPGSVGHYGTGPTRIRSGYYTSKTINATNGSRTIVAAAISVGCVLVRDPYGFDTGIGMDFTQPQTNFLHEQKVVVTAVRTPKFGLTLATDGAPVEFDCVEMNEEVNVLTHANMTAGVTYLAVTNGQFYLIGAAGGASGALQTDTAAHVAADLESILKFGAGLALETFDSSTTTALKKVRFGPQVLSNI